MPGQRLQMPAGEVFSTSRAGTFVHIQGPPKKCFSPNDANQTFALLEFAALPIFHLVHDPSSADCSLMCNLFRVPEPSIQQLSVAGAFCEGQRLRLGFAVWRVWLRSHARPQRARRLLADRHSRFHPS